MATMVAAEPAAVSLAGDDAVSEAALELVDVEERIDVRPTVVLALPASRADRSNGRVSMTANG